MLELRKRHEFRNRKQARTAFWRHCLERFAGQSARYYFAEKDDEESAIQSVYGFDDDAELLNVILEHLDRPDLVIQI